MFVDGYFNVTYCSLIRHINRSKMKWKNNTHTQSPKGRQELFMSNIMPANISVPCTYNVQFHR